MEPEWDASQNISNFRDCLADSIIAMKKKNFSGAFFPTICALILMWEQQAKVLDVNGESITDQYRFQIFVQVEDPHNESIAIYAIYMLNHQSTHSHVENGACYIHACVTLSVLLIAQRSHISGNFFLLRWYILCIYWSRTNPSHKHLILIAISFSVSSYSSTILLSILHPAQDIWARWFFCRYCLT